MAGAGAFPNDRKKVLEHILDEIEGKEYDEYRKGNHVRVLVSVKDTGVWRSDRGHLKEQFGEIDKAGRI